MKAGYLRKSKGVWILTNEGEEAIKLGAEKLLSTATKIYREWDAKRKKEESELDTEDDIEEIKTDKGQAQQARIDQLEENAISGIRDFILRKTMNFYTYGH